MSTDFTDSFILQNTPTVLYQKMDEFFTGEADATPGDSSEWVGWLGWDADTFLMRFKQVVNPVAQDKLLAVKSFVQLPKIVQTDALAFEKVVNAFNNNVCVMDTIQPVYVEEIHYAVAQLNKLHKVTELGAEKDQGGDLEFSGEVPGYIAAVAKHRNFQVLPKPLEFAQDMTTFFTGYAPSADEIVLVDNLDEVYRETPGALLDQATLDALHTDLEVGDRTIAKLIGCYVFDPATSE
jgi:hypothetical protein